MTRSEIESAVVSIYQQLEDAAIKIYSDETKGKDAASDTVLSLLEKSDEKIVEIINSCPQCLLYYSVKSLIYKRNNDVRAAGKQKHNYQVQLSKHDFEQYNFTAKDNTFVYSQTELDKLKIAIDTLPFLEQKIVYQYMQEGSIYKLAKRIAMLTDGVGIPQSTLKVLFRRCKKMIKQAMDEQK